ncbi:acyl-CoA dehydrogenase family protein [Streptomyces boninensis]|uniref:acyl-CoA dehydrogenase family protein n=1 Tax=Streptomyces boninensis TaxID=2039455 RepID=UPI003B210035
MTTTTGTAATADARSLLYSETEDDLRAAVRALLADRSAAADVIARTEAADGPYDAALWKSLARDIGAAGLLIPETLGGAGAGHPEAAVVLEELGRAVTPAPYLTGAVIAVEALLGCDTEPAHGLLREIAEGSRVAVLALPWSAHEPAVTVQAADGRLTGRVTSVADAVAADVLLVPADDGLYAVETARIEPRTPLDLTRPLADVACDSTPGTRLADAATARTAVERALLAGAGLLASEQLGIAEWCLTETVGYLKERRQFARRVGGFQALKHRMAKLWLELVSARAAARDAAGALAEGAEDATISVAVAQAYCADAAVHAAEEALQLHGGIGMTWEHPVHLYLKRAKSDQLALGTTGRHRARLAELVDLPACALRPSVARF